jgi:hypothetical protein
MENYYEDREEIDELIIKLGRLILDFNIPVALHDHHKAELEFIKFALIETIEDICFNCTDEDCPCNRCDDEDCPCNN